MRAARPVALLALVLAACGSGRSPNDALVAAARRPSGGPTTTSPVVVGPSSTATSPTSAPVTQPPATAGPATAGGGATTVPLLQAPTTTPDAGPQLAQAGNAGQAIVVTAPAEGASTATFTAFKRTAGTWSVVYGPWTARVGVKGFAPAGEKREGDGRTPSGTYAFGFFFGVAPDPGVRFPYRVVTRSIVWDDDPESPLYNQWVDRDTQSPGRGPEEMYQPQAYRYGAVINYNTARTPGLGSAIFLHATTDSATAGCVSLPPDQLVEVLKWLDPAQNPRIVMGVG